LTGRRLDNIAKRIQQALPWAAERGVSVHWFRHTAVTEVRELSSHDVARTFAGHKGPDDVTGEYAKARKWEVAQAVEDLTGEPHPLSDRDGLRREGDLS